MCELVRANRPRSRRPRFHRIRLLPRRSRAGDALVFRLRTGCSALPCGWTKGLVIPRAPICPARRRFFFVGMRDSLPGSFAALTEGLWLHFACSSREDFDAGLRIFELFAAGFAQFHTSLEQIEGALERQFAVLHLFHDGFELLQSFFETGRLGFTRRLRVLASLLLGHLSIIRGARM